MQWKRLLHHPREYSWLPLYLTSRVRGWLYRQRYRFSPRVHIGPGFRAEDRLFISGEGQVHIGRDVRVARSNTFPVSIRTLSPEARVNIADGVALGGAQILCRREVTIGEKTFTANCRIQDVDFVSLEHDPHPGVVCVGQNVWIGLTSMLLKRADVGDSSIVAAGSVVERAVGALVIAMGNPARPIRGVLS
jgi:acetyltransferase-like isoleucine patch superfamily enzyme